MPAVSISLKAAIWSTPEAPGMSEKPGDISTTMSFIFFSPEIT